MKKFNAKYFIVLGSLTVLGLLGKEDAFAESALPLLSIEGPMNVTMPNKIDPRTPPYNVCKVDEEGTVICQGWAGLQPPADLGKAISVTVEWDRACIIRESDHHVQCWGRDLHELGPNITSDLGRVSSIAMIYNSVCAIQDIGPGPGPVVCAEVGLQHFGYTNTTAITKVPQNLGLAYSLALVGYSDPYACAIVDASYRGLSEKESFKKLRCWGNPSELGEYFEPLAQGWNNWWGFATPFGNVASFSGSPKEGCAIEEGTGRVACWWSEDRFQPTYYSSIFKDILNGVKFRDIYRYKEYHVEIIPLVEPAVSILMRFSIVPLPYKKKMACTLHTNGDVACWNYSVNPPVYSVIDRDVETLLVDHAGIAKTNFFGIKKSGEVIGWEEKWEKVNKLDNLNYIDIRGAIENPKLKTVEFR